MSLPVRFTLRALEQIKNLRKSMNLPNDMHLRIGVKGGKGCMVVERIIGFDTQHEGDELFQSEGISIVMRKGESLYLAGMEVDYIEDENSRGFVFN
jgi:iron-sulfur cluster assembly protein